ATSGIFDKYVIGTFSDPYTSHVVESDDVATINTFVSGISASAGGDCPEMALQGIREVAQRVSEGSVIFVFTDASSKDLDLESSVQDLLLSKNIRLNVMATGSLCGKGEEFTRLTDATSGTIYKTPNKADVDYVMNYIKNFAKYGIRFIRGMPTTLIDLKEIANGTCSCRSIVENLVCIPPDEDECPCPEGYERVEVRKKVCRLCRPPPPPPPPRPKFGSLGFVIDHSGSMGSEISAVKASIKAILAANKLFKDYVIGKFNDPYKKGVIRSSNKGTIVSFLNAITATGGADCPEYSMSGLRDAVKLAKKRSVIIMFTDASAKDAGMKNMVASLFKDKKSRLFVVATGNLCGRRYSKEYHYVAKESGGAVISLSSKSFVSDVLSFIKKAAAGDVSFDEFPKDEHELTTPKPIHCCSITVVRRCKKVKLPCPPGYSRVVMRQKVCPMLPQCPVRRAGSLGFIIDDSGSMGAEIFAVKSQITSIISKNVRFFDYVIGRFGDPYVKNVIRSADESEILDFMGDITPSGGADCPEFAMSALKDAAMLARDYSIFILFTDAAAKDSHKLLSVAALLNSKNIKLFVVATGTLCGPKVYSEEFHDLASRTGGAVMTLTAKTSISEVLEFIGMAASGEASFHHFPESLSELRKLKCKKCWVQEVSTCCCHGIGDGCHFHHGHHHHHHR
uniref:VWFA domain-containing protein n=1 Tax=Macrostomum lignano TaxID=282301 RepID=A0A1I8I2M0_9PLAT